MNCERYTDRTGTTIQAGTGRWRVALVTGSTGQDATARLLAWMMIG